MGIIRAYFSNLSTFFQFSKKGRGGLPHSSPSYAPLNVAEYPLISLISFDRLLKTSWVVNVPGFWTWLIMQGFHRVLNMSEYGSICLNNAWICLHISQYAWTWLNITKCLWISLNKLFWLCRAWQGFEYASGIKYTKVLNMPHYSNSKLYCHLCWWYYTLL